MEIAPNIEFHEMPNGVRLVHLYDESPVYYCGFAIRVGTRDELESESGMAHFIEHTIFKGTKKRKSWHILNRLESVGGELNAYTTKEETFVYATVLKEDCERAVELCSDIVFHATFPQKEIEKEVDVIIDEIHSYKDTPSELIFDDFEAALFVGSPLGRDILGEAKRLKRYKTADALRFVERTYCTDRILFFSVGKVPFKKVKAMAEKYWGDVPEKRSAATSPVKLTYQPFDKVIKKHTSQTHVMMGTMGYDLSDDKRLTLHLLNNIIGGPAMNSLLNVILRERNGMTYNIESSYTSYSDAGFLSIYYGTDERNKDKCKELILKELSKLREKQFSTLQLDRHKKQLMGQMTISQENRETLALSLAKSVLYFNRFEDLSEVQKQLELVSPTDVWNVSNEVFREDQISYLIYTK